MFQKTNICIRQFSPSTCIFLKTNKNPSNIYPKYNLQSKMKVTLKSCVTQILLFSQEGFTFCDDKCAIKSCQENHYFAQIWGILALPFIIYPSFPRKENQAQRNCDLPKATRLERGRALAKLSSPDPQASDISMTAC